MKMTASVPQIPCQAMAQSSVDSINLKSLTFRTFIPHAARYGYIQKEIQIMIYDVANNLLLYSNLISLLWETVITSG